MFNSLISIFIHIKNLLLIHMVRLFRHDEFVRNTLICHLAVDQIDLLIHILPTINAYCLHDGASLVTFVALTAKILEHPIFVNTGPPLEWWFAILQKEVNLTI